MSRNDEVYAAVIDALVEWRKHNKWWQENVIREKLNRSTEFSQIMLDSLDILELIVRMEEQFDCEIPDGDIEGINTIGSLVDLIVKSPRN